MDCKICGRKAMFSEREPDDKVGYYCTKHWFERYPDFTIDQVIKHRFIFGGEHGEEAS